MLTKSQTYFILDKNENFQSKGDFVTDKYGHPWYVVAKEYASSNHDKDILQYTSAKECYNSNAVNAIRRSNGQKSVYCPAYSIMRHNKPDCYTMVLFFDGHNQDKHIILAKTHVDMIDILTQFPC